MLFRSEINAEALAGEACRIAAASAQPREVPPGRYTTILSPAAVLDLLGFMFYDFSGQAIRDQRSFLSGRYGLTGRIGERLFGENINITDDVYHPLQAGAPFDGEGIPRQRLSLVERGVVDVDRERGGKAPAGLLDDRGVARLVAQDDPVGAVGPARLCGGLSHHRLRDRDPVGNERGGHDSMASTHQVAHDG